jgi:polysaccharide deacetylase family protein (PEP-CTERM system associated)
MNILTIDVEDWYHGIIRINKRPDSWGSYEDRVESSTFNTLQLLKKSKTKATFFILGYVAERHPGLVLKIKDDGHEIATHGYQHQFIYTQHPDEYYLDLKKAKDIIEGIIGEEILGYRAPYFTITKKTLWALEKINDLGFKYDSSIFPTKNNIYGIMSAPRLPYITDYNILEYPPTCRKIFGQNIPVSGGFYFRIFPYWFIKSSFRKINNKGCPVVSYFHTSDLDIEQPKVNCSFFEKFIHYYNLKTMKPKLEKLLTEFQFTSMSKYLKIHETSKNHYYWSRSGRTVRSI